MDKKIITKISRRVTLDEDRNLEFQAYDDMVDMKFELPSGLKNREDVVPFIHPGAHDSEKIGVNIFDTYNPKWEIVPRGPQDKDNAEKLERWVEWQMARANNHGTVEPFRVMMGHSFRYAKIAAQLDYLPHWLPKDKSKWSKEQKRAMKNGPFCIRPYKFGNIHFEMGAYGLRWVAVVSCIPAANVIDHWGVYSSEDTVNGYGEVTNKIKSAIKKVENILEDDETATLTYVDYTDHDKRYVACWYTQQDQIDFDIFDDEGNVNGDIEAIEIVNGENTLPFINWVIVEGSSDSLLSTLHKSHLWANTNISETLKRTAAYRKAFQIEWIEEGNGEDAEFDHTGPGVVRVPIGKKVTRVPPLGLDPVWNELSAQDAAIMASTTSTQNLSNLGGGNNVQYATINAILQTNLTQLTSYRRTTEKAMVELAKLAFQWISFTGNSVKAYRTADKSPQKPAGEQIDIGPEDFDEENLFIEATLIPNTPTDRLQITNMISQLVQMGAPVPWAEHLEKLGYRNPEAMNERWEDEQIERMALKNFDAENQAKLQLKMRQAEMQMQMQAQQAMQQQSPMAQEANPQNVAKGAPTPQVIPGGQGNNPNAGGASPATATPEMTRTSTEQPQ